MPKLQVSVKEFSSSPCLAIRRWTRIGSLQRWQAAQTDLTLQRKQSSLEDSSMKRTDADRRKALERARKALPNSLSKFAEVYIDLGNKASPRKKRVTNELQPSVSGSTTSTPNQKSELQYAKIGENVVRPLASLKKNRSSTADCSRQILLSACKNRKDSSLRTNSTLLGLHRSTLKKESDKSDSGVLSLSYLFIRCLSNI